MRNLEDFFGPFNPETPDLPDAREVAAKKALGLYFPEKPPVEHRFNPILVQTDPATLAIVHQAWVWAGIAREAYQRQSGPRGNGLIDGDSLFIGEHDLEYGCSSGLHVVGIEDGVVSEALMGHVLRDGEDKKNLRYLRRCFGPAVQVHPTAPLTIGIFTGFTGQKSRVLGVAQNNTLRGAEILQDEQGHFYFNHFKSQKVDLRWLLG
jgi:hypothetical protein